MDGLYRETADVRRRGQAPVPAASARPSPGSCRGRARRRARAASRRSVWTSPVPSVARTSIVCVPGRTRPRPTRTATGPTSPSRSASRASPSCHAPSIATSTFAMPRSGAHATPAIGDPAGRRPLAAAGDVDPRLGQDRALLRPAERHPVAVERLERRQLELGSATSSPRRSRTGPGTISRAGKPWIRGSGSSFIFSAIIGSRVGVHHPGGRHARGPAVDRPPDELRRAGLDAGHRRGRRGA